MAKCKAPNLLPSWLPSPMLADKLRDDRLTFPCAVEPKLDGFRITCIDGKGYTRNGNTYETLIHHATVLREAAEDASIAVDCEFMAQNWNETSKLLKRQKDIDHDRIRGEVTAHIFDVVCPESVGKVPYKERRFAVEYVTQEARKRCGGALRFSSTLARIANSREELDAIYEQCLSEGYEGVMVKSLDGVYVPDRSPAWQKLKPEDTVTVTVEGWEPQEGLCPACSTHDATGDKASCNTCDGRGKIERPDVLGALLCRMEDGRKVRVGGGFTQAQRENPESYVGHKIDVKGQDESQTGNEVTIRFPRFAGVRWDL